MVAAGRKSGGENECCDRGFHDCSFREMEPDAGDGRQQSLL